MSVVLSWFFEERQTPSALQILRRIENNVLLVPAIWWSELENGILMGERRGRKKPAESSEFLRLVRSLPIHTDSAPRHRLSDAIIDLGRRYHLTSYDAAYVELSIREKAPLATFDASIRKCAPSLGVKILPD